MSGPDRAECIFGIVSVAVKEMFSVEDDFIDSFIEVTDAVGDQFEIAFKRDAESGGGMEVPTLAEDGDN